MLNRPVSPGTKMIMNSIAAMEDTSESEPGSEYGSSSGEYSRSEIGSDIANVGSQSSCSSGDEPEPEMAGPIPKMLSPTGVNVFENYDRRVPNYSGLNIVNGFYRTKIPELTYTLSTFLQNTIRVYGVDMFFKFNIPAPIVGDFSTPQSNHGVKMRLTDGRIFDPENQNHKEYLDSILTNVLQWIAEFNNSRTSESLDTTQLLFLRETLRTRSATQRTVNLRGEVNSAPGISNIERVYGNIGFFNMVMCYRLTTILLLYNMLPTRCPDSVGAKITNEENNFWFYEFRELKMVLSNLVGIIQNLAPGSDQREYLNEYVIGGLNRINPDLERVSRGGFFKDFFGTILNMSGLQTEERRFLESGIEYQRRMMGGATAVASPFTHNIHSRMIPGKSCKRMSETQKEKIVMDRILQYITGKLGENKNELEKIFSDELMTLNILNKLGLYLLKIFGVGMKGGSAAVFAGMTTAGLGIAYLLSELNNRRLPYSDRKNIAIEILMKQKKTYIMYSVLRVQTQNIYDWTNIYQTFGFDVDDVINDASSELKTISFLGRNSYTILYSLVHYFIKNEDLRTLFNIPLILATTGDRKFDWGKEFALECITRRGNQDVKIIPFIESLRKISPIDEFEVIYSSPDCEIVLPMGITFEQVKGWANECLYGSRLSGGSLVRTSNIERNITFEKDTIENQQKRLEQFAMRFFRRRLDIGGGTGKFTLQLNIHRTNTMEKFDSNTHKNFSHDLVKGFLLNNISTIGETDDDEIPITETFLDYCNNLFEGNNQFLRGGMRRKKTKRRKTKRRKKTKKTKIKKSKKKRKSYRKRK